ncbi:MAG: NADH-quinone oxidoreductase subunit J [Polyangiaceae bacterium]|nr:NADH-quinone oxidoreductase subunit J [Polyangiaceae bacterium]MCW5791685.1 NADH-quinone oxidoreductase subunit J [Polyangiaceae bacterium]
MVGNLYFALCALVCLLGALGCVTSKKPIRGAIGLLATIIGMAGLFLKLNAQFLAAIQLIVYAGAVVVLFVFVIMVLGPDSRTDVDGGRAQISRAFAGGLFALIAGGALVLLAKGGPTPTRLLPAPPGHGDVEAVGGQLFTQAIVPFEITTALLIAAAIGAIAIARGRAVRAPKPHGLPAGEYYHGPVRPEDAAPASKKGTPK